MPMHYPSGAVLSRSNKSADHRTLAAAVGPRSFGLCRVWGSYDAGQVATDATYSADCMALSKSKILAENSHNARIYTLGMGMNMAAPNGYVWNEGKKNWDFYPTEFNDRCRKFLTELAEATGGHYREVSQ